MCRPEVNYTYHLILYSLLSHAYSFFPAVIVWGAYLHQPFSSAGLILYVQ